MQEIINEEPLYSIPRFDNEYEKGYIDGKVDEYLACSRTWGKIARDVAKDSINIIKEQCGYHGEINDWLIALAINKICEKYNIQEEKISEDDLKDMEEDIRLTSMFGQENL